MSSSYWKDHEAKIASEVSGARQRKPSAKVAEASESYNDGDDAGTATATASTLLSSKRKASVNKPQSEKGSNPKSKNKKSSNTKTSVNTNKAASASTSNTITHHSNKPSTPSATVVNDTLTTTSPPLPKYNASSEQVVINTKDAETATTPSPPKDNVASSEQVLVNTNVANDATTM